MTIKQRKKILYVDDQKDNLIVFEAQVSETWEVKCFINAVDALRELKNYNPFIILSDMKMGKMNGIEFLSRGKEILPNAVRMIISGYSNEDLMIASIRYAQVFDFIRKPYDPEDVEVRLQKALVQYEENLKLEKDRNSISNHDKLVINENLQLKNLIDVKNQRIATLESELGELKKSLRVLVGSTNENLNQSTSSDVRTQQVLSIHQTPHQPSHLKTVKKVA